MKTNSGTLFVTLAILSMCLLGQLHSDDKPEAKAHAERAMKLHKEKKFSEAADAAIAAIEGGFRNHDIWIVAADCMMRNNDYKAAHAAFGSALRFDQNSVLALRGLATAALKIGDTETALKATSRLYEFGEKDYMLRGKAFAMNRQHYLAIAEYQKILTHLKPGHRSIIHAYFERGESLLDLSIFDLALADFDRAAAIKDLPNIQRFRGEAFAGMERSEEAIEAYTRSLKLHEHEDVLLLRGREYGHVKDYDKAIADYERALKVAPNDAETQKNATGNIALMKRLAAKPPRPKKQQEPDPYQKEMDALTFVKDPAAAKAHIDSVREEDSNSVSMLHALYRYHVSREDWESAFHAIGSAAKLDRDNLEIFKQFATAAKKLGKIGLVLQAYSRSILFGDKTAHAARAEQLLQLSMGGVALSDIEQALKLEPDNPKLRYWHSISLLEQPAALANNADAAFKRAIDLGFKGERILRAQVLDGIGRHEDAIVDYTFDIENDADYASVRLRRGWCYEKLGKYDLALKDFETAAQRAKPGSNIAKAAKQSIESAKKKLGNPKGS